MSATPAAQDPNKSILCAVVDDGEIALVRVVGRGNFSNSVALKRFAAHVQKASDKKPTFILDLGECEAMDSTFMGVLASIAIIQTQTFQNKVIVLNANDHCRRLLKNLGLSHLVEIRQGQLAEADRGAASLQPAAATNVSHLEQICMTLQAHKELVKLDEGNELRFCAVIEYLEKSLEEEKGKG